MSEEGTGSVRISPVTVHFFWGNGLWFDVVARILAAFGGVTSDSFLRSVVLSRKCINYSQGGVKVPTGGDSNSWRARERLLHISRDQQIW